GPGSTPGPARCCTQCGEVLVELGISVGASIEADLRTRRAEARQQAVTEYILALADQAGYGAALIDAAAQGASAASVITWPQFARMVRAAARGLSRRGLREADTAGIFVQDAVSHVLAVHAVRAAGAIAAPVRPAHTAADIAAQLKDCRARLLITSAELAELAIQAAERSWVRQVFAFGEAEGTEPFGSLLHPARHGQLQASGSNGHACAARVLDLDGPDGLALDGLGLDRPALRLTRRDVVVAAPPCGDPDAYTALLDLALAAGATVVAAPLPPVATAVGVYKGTAAIVPAGTSVPGLPPERIFTVG
ncbi:MAG: AMP-binding protein, partial [Streptosporangiaceae bacterium]